LSYSRLLGIVAATSGARLRLWLNTLLKVVSGTYFVLTSLYCLLAFLPYTFYFLIKAPAYAWMPWFVHHQAVLYGLAAAAAVVANWHIRDSWKRKDRRFLTGAGLLAVTGLYLTFRPFLPGLVDNRAANWWSLAALLPVIAIALWKQPEKALPSEGATDHRPFAYSGGLLIAFVVSMLYVAGARIHLYRETRALSFHSADAELTLWSLISHFVLAIVVLSVINLIFVVAAKTVKPQTVRRLVFGAAVFASLWSLLFGFLQDALSFGGWDARVYAASLALVLTLWGFSLVLPFLEARRKHASASVSGRGAWRQLGTWTALLGSGLLAIAFPYIIGDADWSGFFQSTVTLLLWIVISVCLFRLRPMRLPYSAVVVLSVFLASAAIYKTLQASEIFWSKPLGATDDDISLALEAYAGHDNSFQLAHHILGNSRREVCGDLCRILRENSNIRDTRLRAPDVQLVSPLTASHGERPNVFVFVIDSMRPDYLGPYNPRVDYTPNLDALARDGIVMHNVYTQYAGTSLSEPAIWSGAMMLHAHYLQPFSRLNSLDKMMHNDGYRMMVSMDEVLSAILPADDNLVRLDADKKLWTQMELGSTLRQARTILDTPESPERPIFLYAQPKNVHQFAQNDVPSPTSQHWQAPKGMSARISYEVHWVDKCLGEFFSYLKQRGMYDNSIIIVTSDHGDATGEFGRMSHSTSIWPEIVRVPLIIHLPPKMREHLVYDDARLSTLTDITPTLYYLLGHRPIRQNPLYGRPLLAETKQELDLYPRKDLLLASDVRAVYGILTADGRYLYATYDSPAQSYLFDLTADPNAEHDILTPALKQRYDEEIIEHLHLIGDFYGYRPGVTALLAAAH
jgi:arylsulfatase A-like enzyme